MKKDYTKIVFLGDRSYSMNLIINQIISGYNEFIGKQKLITLGTCDVSFYQFDDVYETVYEDVELSKVEDLSVLNYQPRGSTALYDSLGKCIDDLGSRLSKLPEESRPDKVLFIVLTDGEENASVRFTSKEVKTKIDTQTEVYNWKFSYIGANQDAWAVGSNLGFLKGTTLTYSGTAAGISGMFASLNCASTSYRSTGNYTFTADDVKLQGDLIASGGINSLRSHISD